MVFGAMAQGLGLFAASQLEKEREEADRQWKLALEEARIKREDAREGRAIERENIRTAAETERYAANQARLGEQDKATATHRAATLAQDESQFDRGLVFKAELALDTRLKELDERYKDALAANLGEDPPKELKDGTIIENPLKARYVDGRDEAISSFVRRMEGRPGFEGALDSAEAYSDKLIEYGISSAQAADHYASKEFDLIHSPKPEPGADNRWKPSGNVVASGTLANTRYTRPEQPATPQTGAAAPQQSGPTRQVEAVQPPDPGSLGSLFGEDRISNPNLKPIGDSPAGRGVKTVWDWLQTPTPYSD